MDRPFLRVAARHYLPYMTITTDENSNIVGVGGVMGNILIALSQVMDFNYQILIPPDNHYGLPLSNGSWTGMIGMVHRQEVDFALGPFSLSSQRDSVIDYSFPVVHTSNSILTTRPRVKNDMEGIAKTFSAEVWLAIFVSLVILGFSLSFSSKLEAQLYGDKETHLKAKSLLWSIKALTQESSHWLPKRDGSRLLVAVWLMASLIFMSSFSGILTAMLTVPKVVIPIDSLEDLVSQSEVLWRMIPGTFLVNYFKNSRNELHQKAYNGIAGSIPSCWDAKEDVVSGKYAIICDEPGLKTLVAWDFSTNGRCHTYLARKSIYSNIYAMAFQTKSPLLQKANDVVLNLKESGIMDYWFGKYYLNSTHCLQPPSADISTDNIIALDLEAFGGSFILLGIGYLASLVVFSIEKISTNIWH